MNGAAAHLVKQSDHVDIMAFSWSSGEAGPIFIEVDNQNQFVRYLDPDKG
jgi:aspartate 1-decarboxylase